MFLHFSEFNQVSENDTNTDTTEVNEEDDDDDHEFDDVTVEAGDNDRNFFLSVQFFASPLYANLDPRASCLFDSRIAGVYPSLL